MTHSITLTLAIALASTMVTGCASSPERVDEFEERIAFIEPGMTTRQDIVEKLGPPPVAYDGGRLVVYFTRLVKGDIEVSDSRPDSIEPQLVLEFDDMDLVLRREVVIPP